MSDIEKLAQKRKRSRWNKLYEGVDFSGKMAEHFSPEFQQIMDGLREVDDSVREIAMGDKGSDPGQTLKDLLRVADTNFKRREYMVAISYLGRFHERVEAINAELEKLTSNVDTIHHRFLFDDVDQDQVEYLTKTLAPKFRKNKPTAEERLQSIMDRAKKADIENVIVVEAGITDWWHNIMSDRGKTLAAWEKRFPKYAREIKTQTSAMIARSQSLFDNLLTTLKQLDTFRSTRKLEEYLQAAQKWKERYRAYNAAFITFYNSQIKRFVDYQEDQQKKKDEHENKAREQLEHADTMIQPEGINAPKQWPSKPGEKVVIEQKLPRVLAPLAKDEPALVWETLPPAFQQVFNKKRWERLSEMERKSYYNRYVKDVMDITNKQKKRDVVFPPINTPQSPVVSPAPMVEAPVAEVSPKTLPTVITPKSVPTHSPIPHTPTLRSPGVQQDTMVSGPPAMSEMSEEPVINLVNPKIPPPPRLPKEMMETNRPRRSHADFITALEAKAAEHPMVQAAFILDYASQIEQGEPAQSKSLRALASVILGS